MIWPVTAVWRFA